MPERTQNPIRLIFHSVVFFSGMAALGIIGSHLLLVALVGQSNPSRFFLEVLAFVAVAGTALFVTLRRLWLRFSIEADARSVIDAERKHWLNAFEHCAIGIGIADPESNSIRACNRLFAKLHEMPVEEMVRRAVKDLYEETELPEVLAKIAAGDVAGKVQFVARRRRKDGSMFTAQEDYVFVRPEGSGSSHYRVVTIQDVTEREKAALAQSESEKRFRELVETIQEVFWITDATGSRTVYASPGYEKIWARRREDLYQDSSGWLMSVHPDDRVRVAEAAGRKAAGGYDESYRIVQPAGGVRWIRDRAFPVKAADGSISRIVGVAEDISDRKVLEQQFLRSQRMEAIGTLAAGVAHDLNNILAPVLMIRSLLKSAALDPADVELLATVERSAHRGTNIVQQLLTFSGETEGKRGPMKFSQTFDDIAAIVRAFPTEIAVSTEVDPAIRAVRGDATQLHQAVFNLCVNARDAMPLGGRLKLTAKNTEVTPAVAMLHGAKPGAHVLVQVEDTGEGIDGAVIDRIFDPFFTSKEAGKGTGLGLSAVLGIVKNHGGFIDVESRPGCTRFSVYIPAIAEQGPAEPAPAEPDLSGSGETLLVVDDEQAMRDVFRRVGEKYKYTVLVANDGEEGLKLFIANRDRIKLMLTDVMMPKIDGVGLARAVLKLAPSLPIIAMTGVAQPRKEKELINLGVICIHKPCNLNDLLARVRKAISR